MAPTLQDIAREAGVSAMAVSVVLNRSVSSTRVSDATRDRILAAATKLDYRPNAVARGLQRRRMDTIGVVAVVDSEDLNVYFLELLNGILTGADEFGQNMTVFSIHDWVKDQDRITQLCDGRIDGMILLGPRGTLNLTELLPRHTPVVSIHSNVEAPGLANISTNGESGAYEAVNHLIGLGHKRIMHLAGPDSVSDAHDRLLGYKRALNRTLEYRSILISKSRVTTPTTSGKELMAKWLAVHKGKVLPTAVFAANDATAVGVVEALNAAGYSVPGDVSVVGFDDSLMARMCNPPLTSLRQPLREMGRKAVELLMWHLETHTPQQSELFPTELVVRASTTRLREPMM